MDILHKIVKNAENKACDYALFEVCFKSGSHYYLYFTMILFYGLNT